MIVEDDRPVALNLRLGLEALGYEACVAYSKNEALQILAGAEDISVVMTDIRMPGGSGLELAEALGQMRTEATATEVVVITGHATLEDTTLAMRSGVCDFLLKPFRLAEADAAVRKAAAKALHRRTVDRERCRNAAAVTELEQDLAKLRLQWVESHRAFRALDGTHGWSDQVLEQTCIAVSHALRTSLNAILGGAELMGTNILPARRDEYLEMLRGGVKNAVTAIELIEELNRLHSNDQVPGETFDLAPMIEQAALAIGDTRGAVLPRAALMVTASTCRIRRALTLCFEAAAEWAPTGSEVSHDVRVVRDDRGAFACLTITISPPGQSVTPPGGIAFAEGAGFLSRTIESLRFLIAQRLVAHGEGFVTSWEASASVAAIRLTLPLARGDA